GGDGGVGVRIERNVDLHLALEVPVAVEHLDAAIVAVADIDIALGIGGDRMHEIEFAGALAVLAPRLHPVAVLVVFGDACVHVAVADEDVALRIPGHIGRLAEAAVDLAQSSGGVWRPRPCPRGGGCRAWGGTPRPPAL